MIKINIIKPHTNIYYNRHLWSKNYYKLPLVSKPLVLYNLKGARNVNNNNNCFAAIKEQKALLDKGKITETQYNERIEQIKKYYNSANSLPENVSSDTIKKGAPNFKAAQIGEGNETTLHSLESDEVYESNISESGIDSDRGLFSKIVDKFNNLKEKFSINFKGQNEDLPKLSIEEWTEKYANVDKISAKDFLSLDTSLPPDLQAVLDAPPIEVADGFLGTIKDYVSDGSPDDIFEHLKNMVQEIEDMM